MASDVLACLIMDRIRDGETLPRAAARRGICCRPVSPLAQAALKAELLLAFLAVGIRKVELARRMGIQKSNVDRLFDLKHTPPDLQTSAPA